ncbi:hypothetical protein RhiirA1_474693 [Rhizophagus irregularis]|uniref:Uncharacterized protein n=1 Tax=Rhizophagus irregularis TaxID=588596 RepID=A0A2N0QY52_9GLOM|nr:hypothetical protein RhiirA1_474693 [Rhizophagus irregularis]
MKAVATEFRLALGVAATVTVTAFGLAFGFAFGVAAAVTAFGFAFATYPHVSGIQFVVFNAEFHHSINSLSDTRYFHWLKLRQTWHISSTQYMPDMCGIAVATEFRLALGVAATVTVTAFGLAFGFAFGVAAAVTAFGFAFGVAAAVTAFEFGFGVAGVAFGFGVATGPPAIMAVPRSEF